MVETADTGQRRVVRIARITWLLVGVVVGLISYFDFEERVSFFRFMLTTFPWEIATIFALGFALTSPAEVTALLRLLGKLILRALREAWAITAAIVLPTLIAATLIGTIFFFYKLDENELTMDEGVARVQSRIERFWDQSVSAINRYGQRAYDRAGFYSRAITDGYRLYQMRRGREAIQDGNIEGAIRSFSGAATWYPSSTQTATAIAWRDVALSRQVYARNQYARAAAMHEQGNLTPYGLALTLTALRADPRHREAAELMTDQLNGLRRSELFTTRIIAGCLTLEGSDLRPRNPLELAIPIEAATGPADAALIASGDYSPFCSRLHQLRDRIATSAEIETAEDGDTVVFDELEQEAQAALLARHLAEQRWALRHICARLADLPGVSLRLDDELCVFSYSIEFDESDF